MWVKLTLPPLDRRKKLLIIERVSMTSFIGTERTEVAVGMVNEASMFLAVRIGAPFITWLTGPVVSWAVRTFGSGRSADSARSLFGLDSGAGVVAWLGVGRSGAGAAFCLGPSLGSSLAGGVVLASFAGVLLASFAGVLLAAFCSASLASARSAASSLAAGLAAEPLSAEPLAAAAELVGGLVA